METFLTHSCNKMSHFWPSEIIVGTEVNLVTEPPVCFELEAVWTPELV
jgi:hypothetical protein